MKIHHLALWAADIENVRSFYEKYFNADGEKYVNPNTGFTSYMLTFGEGCNVELMHKKDILNIDGKRGFSMGYAHFALCVGTKTDVDSLTERLRTDGYTIASEPRTTGDGYYESGILDPEGNYVELTAE